MSSGFSGDALSSILGWVSIASWIVVYSPQIYENYVLQSGHGLSVIFVVVWLLGDLCNLTGAVLAGLLPTVIILGLYYTICDLILLLQIYYYRWKRGYFFHSAPEEQAPLLAGDSRSNQDVKPVSTSLILLRYAAALLFVISTGVLVWWITDGDKEDNSSPIPDHSASWKIQLIGWTGAFLYLAARIPQIAKNFTTHCDGLSPALFFFAILGNTTYVLSICAKSMEKKYLITNASWLAGSGLTVFLDVFVGFSATDIWLPRLTLLTRNFLENLARCSVSSRTIGRLEQVPCAGRSKGWIYILIKSVVVCRYIEAWKYRNMKWP